MSVKSNLMISHGSAIRALCRGELGSLLAGQRGYTPACGLAHQLLRKGTTIKRFAEA